MKPNKIPNNTNEINELVNNLSNINNYLNMMNSFSSQNSLNPFNIGNNNYVNNNRQLIANNNNYSSSQISQNDPNKINKKKSNEALNRDIFVHILRLNFYYFLNNVKEIINKKLRIINIYFFILKHSYNPFITNLRIKVKCKELKRKIKIFQCRKFFKYTRSQINLIKNPVGSRITTVHAYLYYFNKLKQKLLIGLKKNIKMNKLNNHRTLLLFSIRNKISVLYMYREMRKVFINKDNKLYLKTCFYIRKTYFKYLKENRLVSQNMEECFRLIRKYQYLNDLKNIMNHFRIDKLKQINAQYKDFSKQTKYFMIRKTIRQLKKYKDVKKKINAIQGKIADKTKFHFLQRVKRKMTNKIIVNRNLNVLIGLIKKYYRRKYFPEFYRRVDKFCINTKKLTMILIRKIGFNYLKSFKEKRKKEKLNLIKLNRTFKKFQKRQYFENYLTNIKISQNFRMSNNNSIMWYKKQIDTKVINGLKLNKQMNRKKRNMTLKAKRFNEKLYKSKIMKSWRFYLTYKKNKRNEYLYAKNKRDEIISRHLVQYIVNISSEDDKINDNNDNDNKNIINNSISLNNSQSLSQSIHNSSRQEKKSFINFNDSININNNNNNFSGNKDLMSDLKMIRNKQRTKPVILDLDSL